MRRLVMSVCMAASAAFLWWDRTHPPPEPPKPWTLREPDSYGPTFSPEELQQLRSSTQDLDPEVRWAAAALLYNIRDPRFPAIAERMLAEDPDASVRERVVSLYKGGKEDSQLGALVKGLGDTEKSVRLAALAALGDIGDPTVSVWVINALKDPEAEVRAEALRTLGRFQEKRKAEFDELAKKLREDYQKALAKAKRR